MKRYLLIDGNSIGHSANASRKLTVGDTEVQAIFVFLRVVKSLVNLYAGATPIVLWDGASWRRLKYAAYKENRDRAETAAERKALEAKQGFKKQADAIVKGLELLGVTQVKAFNMEADDLAAIIGDRYTAAGHSVALITADKDWLQLVGPRCIWHDPIHDKKVSLAEFEEKTGVKTTRQFVEVKAIMGDAGDNVPGVGGIGDKGAIEFINTYGSFQDFVAQVTMEKTIDFKSLPKKYRALIEDESKATAYYRNLELVDLRTTARPAPINLTVNKGTPSGVRFQAFCRKLLFRSIIQDFEAWTMMFPALLEDMKEAA